MANITPINLNEIRFATVKEVIAFSPDKDSLERHAKDQHGNHSLYRIAAGSRSRYNHWNYGINKQEPVPADAPAVFVVEREDSLPHSIVAENVSDFAFCRLSHGYGYGYQEHRANRIVVTAAISGHPATFVTTMDILQKKLGMELTRKLTLKLNGIEREIPNWQELLTDPHYRSGYSSNGSPIFDFTLEYLSSITSYNIQIRSDEGLRNFLFGIMDKGASIPQLKMSGIQKSLSKCQSVIDELKNEDPLVYCYIRSLLKMSHRAIDGVKVSTVLNETFESVKTTKDLLKLWELGQNVEESYYRRSPDHMIKTLPAWVGKRKAALKSQGNRAYVKLMQEYDSLKLDEKKFPKTAKAIKNGDISIGTFFRKSEQYFTFNDNWGLWEKMLTKHRDVTIELANEVKKRSNYEKDLMSYFYFVLYALPKYLKKHTGENWTCKPRLVESQEELEPPTEDSNGVSRKRSALTPVADNETKVVTVPYASLAIPGRQTTYCYALDYHVLTEGFSFAGNTVTQEIEEKLNGRDDYGLCYYTLTGSAQGRGYPTFLIIFERRSKDTVVHFHRTHPSRSKDGDYNPIHNWIRVCYNWMVGNIPLGAIAAQQGDLAFVKSDKKVEYTKQADSYDKHCFETPVEMADGPQKSNILCYVNIAADTWLKHTEHENVLIPAGAYEIRQARSWEANPKGVWSLRID